MSIMFCARTVLRADTDGRFVFLARIMKHLAATNVVCEVGPDTYASTLLSNSLTEAKYRDGIIYTYVYPDEPRQNEHRNPFDPQEKLTKYPMPRM